MASSDLASARKGILFNAWLTLWLLIGVTVVANVVSTDSFLRLDLTSGRHYTLSPATRDLLARLEDPLTVRVYFAADLAPPYHQHAQVLRDKLDEYRAHASGRMEILWQDPGTDAKIEEEARRFGIQSNQLQIRDRNKMERRKVYMGLALVYRDRQEVIPFLDDMSALEYSISRAIKNLLDGSEKKTIGFLVGHGEPDFGAAQGQLQQIKARFEENYKLVSVKLGDGTGVPTEVDALVVLGARQPLAPREKFELNQYVMRGGPVAWFVTQLIPDLKGMKVQKTRTGVEDLLEAYGVKLLPETIIDRKENGALPMPMKRGPFTFQGRVNTPLIPVASRFNGDSLLVRNLRKLPLPFASPLQLTEAAKAPGFEVTELAFTGEASTGIDMVPSLDPAALAEPVGEESPGPFLVGISIKGPFASAWAGKPVPEAGPGTPKEGETELTELLDKGKEDSKAPTDDVAAQAPESSRMLVFGSSDFALGSLDFLEGTMDWLVLDDTLLAIRPKTTQPKVLEETTPGQQMGIKLANVLGVPGLLIAFGLLRARRRARIRA